MSAEAERPEDVVKVCRECGEEAPHGRWIAREGPGGCYVRIRTRPMCRPCWNAMTIPRVRARERRIAAEKRARKKVAKKRKLPEREAPRAPSRRTPESEARRLAREAEIATAWRSFLASHRWHTRGGARRDERRAS